MDFPFFGTNGPIGYHTDYLAEQGVIIGRKGVYRGVYFSDTPFWVIDTAFFLQPIAEFDLRWAYYQLKDFDINNVDSGTAIPSTSRQDFYAIPVVVPPLETQHTIAAILSAYDDLIENNNKRIKLLEQAAHDLYREWFVHFRFPGYEDVEMVDSGTDYGIIPRGWEVKAVSEVITINLRIPVDKGTDKPLITMRRLSTTSMVINVHNLEFRTGKSGAKFQNYDTLFARITPCLEKWQNRVCAVSAARLGRTWVN